MAVPSPLTKLNRPPVCTVLRPAMTRTSPPTLLVSLPATEPPRPSVTAPVPTQIWPLLPELEVPELNTSTSDTPPVPAFALRMTTVPLASGGDSLAAADAYAAAGVHGAAT